MADALAGLLVFDLMCLAAVQRMFPATATAGPFAQMTAFVQGLPFATIADKQVEAANFVAAQKANVTAVPWVGGRGSVCVAPV